MSDRRRPLRLFAILFIAASLAVSTFASPVSAALADIDFGGGTTPGTAPNGHGTGATPTQVSPGNVAGFYIWVRNDDTAKLNSFFMKAATTATPLGAYWSRNGGPANACTTTDGLQCAFGALESGDVLRITAAFTLPTGTSTSTANCLPAGSDDGVSPTGASWRCVDFQFASGSGFVPGKNNSRGDLYHWFDFVRTDGGADRGAQFPFCNLGIPAEDRDCDEGLLTVFNTLSATKRNPQATQVTAPDAAFNSNHGSSGIAVEDGAAFECPDGLVECAAREDDFVGQWSDVSVNSEQPFGDDFLRVTIQMNGVKASDVDGVLHLWEQPAGTWHEEVIDDLCPSSAGPGEGQTTPCFWVTGSGNNSTVDIWSHNNGKFGHF